MRRRVGRTLAGEGYVEVLNFPFIGRAPTSTGSALDGADPRRTTLRLANPLSNEEPLMTTTLLPGLLRTRRAQRQPRAPSDLALFETAPVTLPHSGVGAPILPVDRRPTEGEWDDAQQGAPGPAAAPRLRRLRRPRPRRLVGRGTPRALERRRSRPARVVAGALGLELDVRPPASAPWHPGRCAELLVGETSVGHAGELHPQGVPGLRRARRARRSPSSTSTPCWRGPSVATAPGVLDLPGGQGGRRARRGRRPARPRSSPPPCARVPGRCASPCGSSTSTPGRRSARGTSRWPSRCASAHPTAR